MAYDILRWARGPHCRNRRVVAGPEGRRHSPIYDDEGDAGKAWHEFGDAEAMCTFGACTGTDSEVWLNATDQFYKKIFIPKYNQLQSIVKSSGVPMTDSQARVLQESKMLIDEWRKHAQATNADPPSAWNSVRLRAVIRQTVNFFDEAACRLDNDVNPEIANIRPGMVEPPAMTPIGPPPGGGKWIGGAGYGHAPRPSGQKKEEKSMLSTAVGAVALGAAGYFAFKVLTE